ncbi:MAG: hypothetical protein KDA61_15490 [Planctomycetales bacterium]|nr:hypothetical protein [Planctomycetales bacterium]
MKTFVSAMALAFAMSTVAMGAVATSVETDIAPPGSDPGVPYTPTFASGGPSSTDLLHGASPSDQSGDFTRETSTGTPALTDGSVDTYFGTGTAESVHSAYATGADGEYVAYSLGGAFNLTEVVIYGGWNDAGRDAQHYDLLASSDMGATFALVGSIDVNPGVQGTDVTPVSNRVAFSEDALAFLATNVTDIRVNFLGVENGYTGYTEIDVFGEASPEPTTWLVACCGLLGLASRRRAC